MGRRFLVFALSFLILPAAFATQPVVPTTTLSAETGNNTSTASTFTGMSNGNVGATNVSKVSIKTLMYPGYSGKMYAHLMGWFGPSNHYNVGYSSNTASQVALQVTDMASRGYDGLILDWYGPSHGIEDQVAQLLATEVPKHPGFSWALIEDAGALSSCANTSGCDVTAKLISDLTYAYNHYEQSASYSKVGGRPVVAFFGVETVSGIDWTRVQAGVPGNPVLIWRNSGGFSKPLSSGSFSWVNPNSTNPSDIGISYLDNFYSSALTYPLKSALTTGYKGFNDTPAAWSKNRIMNQNCGQTWLASMAEAAHYYSSTLEVYGTQIATWNDYEEGTETETGIDNCVSISATVAGSTVSWSITGQENTLDHYTVYISADGQNLMPVADVATGTYGLDLSHFDFDPGTYKVFVKAVGKPSMVNHMSAAIPYGVANQDPVAKLSTTPSSGIAPVTVTATTAGSYDPDGSVVSTSINWGDGSSTASASGTHTYSTPGTYTVVASVTDSLGATSTASSSITVAANQPPVVKLAVTPASGTTPVTVTASTSGSYDPDGTVAATVLNWGDGTTTSAASGSHVYSTAGTYTVTATLTDNLGAKSQASATISAAAPVSTTTTGVKVSNPLPGATVTSPAYVTATATTVSTAHITAMKVYVDGVARYSTSYSNFKTFVSMTSGSHKLTVQAWDSAGNIYKNSMTVTAK